MKDAALVRAIEAAGGLSALARAIGIKPQSVNGWTQCPAQRVLAVEAASGISRSDLRPDIYPLVDHAIGQ